MYARFARAEDEEQCVALARMNVEELLPHLVYDEAVARATFHRSLTEAQPTFFVAEEGGGELVGFIMALTCGYGACAGFFATQEVFYVRPDKRGTRAAALLVQKFNDWADSLGPEEVHAGVANGFQPERTARFFEYYGFERVGLYLRRITGGKRA